MPKQERELSLVGMYVRCERTLIIVGNKRRIYSPSFECLILSVDFPEHASELAWTYSLQVHSHYKQYI